MLNLDHANRSNIIQLLLLLVFLAMTACSSGRDTHISPQALFEMIQGRDTTANQVPIIVDTRSQYEYDQGHVPEAIHLPFWAAFARADEVPIPIPGQSVVVYCAHGPRAGIAKWALSLNGYESILYLNGHMTAWSKAELPVEQ